jgi:hypothetical protein
VLALVRLDRRAHDPELGYAEEGVVAESARLHGPLSSGLGIDMTGASIPYLASWAEHAPLATIEATAGLLDRLARRIDDVLTRAKPTPKRDRAAGRSPRSREARRIATFVCSRGPLGGLTSGRPDRVLDVRGGW